MSIYLCVAHYCNSFALIISIGLYSEIVFYIIFRRLVRLIDTRLNSKEPLILIDL